MYGCSSFLFYFFKELLDRRLSGHSAATFTNDANNGGATVFVQSWSQPYHIWNSLLTLNKTKIFIV